ncbi:MAG: hypothetical protein OXF02_05975 [Simkaniaceae bacterium]|nr:hypothetical protein [Simkaniaceae bacterium]
MSVEDVTESLPPGGVRVMGGSPEDVGARAFARKVSHLGRRVANYVFGCGPVEHLAVSVWSGLVGGLVGGVVGFGIGLTPGAVVGVFVGVALSDGLASAILVAFRPRAGYNRPGESRDGNGATESDGASTDSGSTALTETEEEVFRILHEGLNDPELYAGPGLGAQS